MPTEGDTGWDRRLAAALAAGDERALRDAYDQYAPVVFGASLRLVGDRALSADLCRDVFVSLWRRPCAFDPASGSLRSWLVAQARRRAVVALRERGRRDLTPARRATATPVPPPDLDEAVAALVDGERVRSALRDLPADLRRTVELAFDDGCTHRQVAERLDLPDAVVPSWLRLALVRLAARDDVARRA